MVGIHTAGSHAQIFRGPILIVLFIVEIGLVVAISAAIRKISAPLATGLFLLYSAINGLTLSAIFVIYTGSSIASAFLVSAGMFAAVSLYGYVTKTDLTRFGGILFMLLIGLVIASVVSMFWANSAHLLDHHVRGRVHLCRSDGVRHAEAEGDCRANRGRSGDVRAPERLRGAGACTSISSTCFCSC